MGITLLQVDAFTDKPFAGNPAAVCLLPEPRPDHWLQDVAREMNLSETAYLLREGDGFRLRSFTPVMEAELCGHATLASAHALWELGEAKPSETIKFSTCSGPASAVRRDGWIELDFPAEPAEQAEAPPALMRALGVKPLFTGKNRMDWIVEVESEEIVRGLKPDFALLATCPDRGVMVTSRSASKEFDFASRYFGPQSGID